MKKRDASLFKRKYLNNETKQEEVSHCFFPTPLIYTLQQEVLKFNDICVSWS